MSQFAPFYPPQRTLMGPGPSDVSARVLGALSRPTIGHLDPKFTQLMEEIKELLRFAFQTSHAMTFPVSAPGSSGMEMCFVNLVEPGDKILVCRNGVFGERMRQNVLRAGGEAILVDNAWGAPISIEHVEETLKNHSGIKAVAMVHAETSTGVRSDVAKLSQLAHQHQALSIVDTVTSLGGIPLKVDEWELDAVYSGTQKCLSCIPGLSPVTFSERALKAIEARETEVQSWFLDINLVRAYWDGQGGRTYHHTAPVNQMYALHEALLMLHEEGLQQAWDRHQTHHRALGAGLQALGLKFVVDEAYRLPQLNSIWAPEGVDEAKVRQQVLNQYDLEIGAGLGDFAGRAWRIGLMGNGCHERNVRLCVTALEDGLRHQGVKVGSGVAKQALDSQYESKN